MSSSEFGSLAGLHAVVTGSTSGIGRAIARELSRGGADVLIHGAKSATLAQAVADEINQSGGRAVVQMADLAQSAELPRFVEQCWSQLNGIDIWVNNAGVDLLTGPASEAEFSAKLQRLYEIDVRATLSLSRLIGARMRVAGGGTIINIGWDQAERGMEGESGELFAAAKNAVMGFTRSVALSLAPTVRVNCIAPGWIRTKWGEQASPVWQERVLRETPLRRWGTPEDVAAVARFLASREASYLTGQVIYVNGGAER